MRNFFNYIVTNFGFSDCHEFYNSILHPNLTYLTIPLVGISSVVEKYFGLEHLTIISFVILIFLELVTGLMSSKIRKVKIESRKFSRFGLKVLIWLFLIFITNSLRMEYQSNKDIAGVIAYTMFNWLHTFLFIYINMEYLISVLENLGVITGNKKQTTNIIKMIKNKLYDSLKK
jgi:hypothetical protein